MKKSLITFVVALVLSFSNVNAQTTADLIESTEPFTKDGVVQLKNVANDLGKNETGSIESVSYRFYYSDGTGVFQGTKNADLKPESLSSNWSVQCQKDVAENSKVCFMRRGDLFIFLTHFGLMVAIGDENRPETDTVLQIDSIPAYKTSLNGFFQFSQNKEIIEKLKTAKKVTTSYQPISGPNVNGAWEVYGFNEALRYITWAYHNIK